MTKERIYRRDGAVMKVVVEPTQATIYFELAIQFSTDANTGQLLSRFAAFPAQIGIGDSEEEARSSLTGVYRAYVEEFLIANGLTRFEEWLLSLGFELYAPSKQEDWTPLVFQSAVVPPVHYSMAC